MGKRVFRAVLLAALAAVSGAQAAEPDALKAVLAKIKLPGGFHISLYALAPGARAMAVSPDKTFLIVGTTDRAVYKIPIDPAREKPPLAQRFAPKLSFALPNGPCFAPDGSLFIVEQNRVLRFAPLADGKGLDESSPKAVIPQGQLIPASETSRNHSARVCRVGRTASSISPSASPITCRRKTNYRFMKNGAWAELSR